MVSSDKSQSGGLGRVFTRGIKIRGPHDGELRSDQRAIIEADAIVSGDVIAPQVVVKGLVSGRILALDLVVEAHGQVWGDTWARSLTVKPGGRVRGWVSELTPPLAAVIESGQPIPDHIASGAAEETAGVSHLTNLDALRAELIEALLARKRAEREIAEWALQDEVSDEEAGDQQSARGETSLARGLIQAQDREEKLKGTIEELEEALAEMTGRRDDAIALVVEHELEIQSLSGDLDQQRQRVARLLDDLAKANETAGGHKRELDKLSAEFGEHKVQTRKAIGDLSVQLAGARQEIQRRNKLLDDIGSNLVQSQEHVEQQHMELLTLREQVDVMTQRDQELQASAKEAIAARASAEEALAVQESEILRLQAELDVVISESDQERAEIARLERQLTEGAGRIASLQARLADEAGARRELDRLQEQLEGARHLAEAQRKLAETRSQALSEVQTREEQLLRKQRRLERELAAAEAVERGLSAEQTRTLRLEIDLQEARDQVALLRKDQVTQKEQFRKVLGAAREQMDRLQGKLEREQGDYAQTQEQMAAWRIESERVGRELAILQEKNEEVQSELNLARSVIGELNADISDLTDRLDERDQTVARLYVELAEGRSDTKADQPVTRTPNGI